MNAIKQTIDEKLRLKNRKFCEILGAELILLLPENVFVFEGKYFARYQSLKNSREHDLTSAIAFEDNFGLAISKFLAKMCEME